MAQQVKTITSEAIESAYRALTPSQTGFTEDLMASNVIIPTLNLNASASGETIAQNLQTAWDFSTGHSTIENATTTLVSNTGFWLVELVWNGYTDTAAAAGTNAEVFIDDGVSQKTIWKHSQRGGFGTNDLAAMADVEFVVFLRSGDTLKASTDSNFVTLEISYRQIADVNGNLTNPLGFTPQ
jgi:hypothetical protein